MDLTIGSLLLYGLPLVGVIALYLWRRASNHRAHAEQLAASSASGLNEPASLHPVVDPDRCLGSGLCVRACPEQALGVVNGKAVLVNASACIGHGACESACPTQAIRLVFGTERRGVDIPAVKPNFESNVPGIFIAGELGGMGLIRKAAEQGRQAMEAIRKQGRTAAGEGDVDVVIIGAGPAGLAAGLYALQHKMRFALVEQEHALGGTVAHYPRNKLTMTEPVKLPLVGTVKLGHEVRKETLLETWQQIVGRTGLRIRFGEKMEQIERADGLFVVRTSRRSYRAASVLLAVGRRGTPRKLGVPGEELPKVVYRLIDPEQYRGQRVLVVGGGDSAVEAAVALAEQPGCRVALSYRGEAFARIKPGNRERLAALQAARRLQVLLRTAVREIDSESVTLMPARERAGDSPSTQPVDERPVTLKNDAVIVCAGGELPFDLLKRAGIAFETKYGTA